MDPGLPCPQVFRTHIQRLHTAPFSHGNGIRNIGSTVPALGDIGLDGSVQLEGCVKIVGQRPLVHRPVLEEMLGKEVIVLHQHPGALLIPDRLCGPQEGRLAPLSGPPCQLLQGVQSLQALPVSHHHRYGEFGRHAVDLALLGIDLHQVGEQSPLQLSQKAGQVGEHPLLHVGLHRQAVQQQQVGTLPVEDLGVQGADQVLRCGSGIVSHGHPEIHPHVGIGPLELAYGLAHGGIVLEGEDGQLGVRVGGHIRVIVIMDQPVFVLPIGQDSPEAVLPIRNDALNGLVGHDQTGHAAVYQPLQDASPNGLAVDAA